MDSTIWLVGNSDEPSIDAHIAALNEAAERLKVRTHFIGRGFDFSEIRASISNRDVIYWRYKMTPPTFPQSMEHVAYRFSALEWRETLYGVCKSSGAIVLNGYDAITVAGNKPLQLEVAKACGLETPHSLITNNKSKIIDFIDSLDGSRVMRKPISGYDIPDPADMKKILLLAPSIVTVDEIVAIEDQRIESCPMIFQQYVEKLYELRVLVVGDSVVTYEIDSQGSEHTQLDWRKGIMGDMYKIVSLQPQVQSLLLAYLRMVGLFSGVFDLIVTPDDRVVFLECNPNGQWMWLDYLNPGYVPDLFITEIAKQCR